MASYISFLLPAPLLIVPALGFALPGGDLALRYGPDHPIIQALEPVQQATTIESTGGAEAILRGHSPAKLFARQYTCDPGYGFCSRT